MAIANSDGSIVLTTKIDVSGVSKALDTLKAKIDSVKEKKAAIQQLTQAIKDQQYVIKQLEIADRLGLPFCIHCRNAVSDLYNVLNESKHLIRHSGLMHCYSEGGEWIQKFLDLGLYISFSGNITFKKNDSAALGNALISHQGINTTSLSCFTMTQFYTVLH